MREAGGSAPNSTNTVDRPAGSSSSVGTIWGAGRKLRAMLQLVGAQK